jgi:hypothetical protein
MTFDEFERDWLRRHRALVPRRRNVSSGSEFFWIIFWLIVAAGAAVFSAVHTIPAAEMTILASVEGRSDLAKSVFVIGELVIFGAAAKRREIPWMLYLLGAALLVLLMGNISSSVRAVSENGGDILNQIGGILQSIIAPFTALGAGEILHVMLDKRQQKIMSAEDEYSAKLVELQAKINSAWKKHEKEVSETDRQTKLLSMHLLSEQTDSRQTAQTPMRSGYGHNRTPDGQRRVVEYLTDNPGDASLPLRALADKIGVNKDTVNAGRKLWQQELSAPMSIQTNGNGHHG